MATYKQVLESLNLSEEKPKDAGPGDVWQTDSGGFRGINQSGNPKTFQDKEKTQKYVATKDSPKDDTDKDKEEPKKEKPKADEPEKVEVGGDFEKVERGGRTKTLDSRKNPSKSETFTQDIDPSDDDYPPEEQKKWQVPDPPPPLVFEDDFSVDENGNQRFPKKYMKFLERAMNSQKKDDKPAIGNMISQGGAGRNSAQVGEVMTMMACSMSTEDWDKVSKQLLAHEQAQKDANPSLEKEGTRMVNKGWIESATNNRTAVMNQVEGLYGKGAVMTHSGWDTKEDAESLGWTEYGKQKGFSSDFYGRVKLANGQSVMHEVSLKKNTVVNILNSGVGEATEWNPKLKGTDLDPEVLGKQEKSRLDNFSKKNEKEIRALADTEPLKSQMSLRGLKIEQVLNVAGTTGSSKDKSKAAFMAMNMLAGNPNPLTRKNKMGGEGMKGYNDKDGKVYMDDPPTEAQLAIKDHIDALKDYAAGFTRELVKSPMKEKMLESIKTKLPITAVATGEETMAIGDLSFDKNTMKKMFGTTNIEEIRDHLEIDESTNPPSLSYEASPGPDGSNKRVQIASIVIRPNGTGYSGGGMRFDMKMTTDFANQLKDANYGEDGVYKKPKSESKVYESLEGTISRIVR